MGYNGRSFLALKYGFKHVFKGDAKDEEIILMMEFSALIAPSVNLGGLSRLTQHSIQRGVPIMSRSIGLSTLESTSKYLL
ncbi:MAG: hypothetical protein QXF04_04100 [Candidatus Aenigmatarchaeota archaeon]